MNPKYPHKAKIFIQFEDDQGNKVWHTIGCAVRINLASEGQEAINLVSEGTDACVRQMARTLNTFVPTDPGTGEII